MIYGLNSTLHELLVVTPVWGAKLALATILGKLAAAETSSVGQVPALNPDKHRLGSAKLALIYVNAQDLPPSFTLCSKRVPQARFFRLAK